MPDFTTSSQPVGSDEEEKKEDAPVDPFESDEEEKKEEEESSEELDAEQDDIKDKVDNADDEEIGVQEVQDEVRGAASTHVTEDLNNFDNLDAHGVDFSGDVIVFLAKSMEFCRMQGLLLNIFISVAEVRFFW